MKAGLEVGLILKGGVRFNFLALFFIVVCFNVVEIVCYLYLSFRVFVLYDRLYYMLLCSFLRKKLCFLRFRKILLEVLLFISYDWLFENLDDLIDCLICC